MDFKCLQIKCRNFRVIKILPAMQNSQNIIIGYASERVLFKLCNLLGKIAINKCNNCTYGECFL